MFGTIDGQAKRNKNTFHIKSFVNLSSYNIDPNKPPLWLYLLYVRKLGIRARPGCLSLGSYLPNKY
ncbi:hypothetical protein KSS87_016635 [Heliosperma pusillum]|nr:hypothetical protein KSS87_000301 [Heliosperma pusillum]KAH9617520.1 hypothetical protein KSS87_007550 [Heliosperma pusillum]KAH9624132.1 hypothetical protein KSS87_016635 [Heliosperma pusillum]